MPYFERVDDEWVYHAEEPPELWIADETEQAIAQRAFELGPVYEGLDAPTLASSTDYRFILRIFKRLAANPGKTWSNVYELKTATTTNITTVMTALYDFLSYEKQFHLATVDFFKAVISTWKPDGAPYNPYSFTVFDLSEVGNRGTGGVDAEPVEATYYVSKNCGVGHNGKLWYRGCLLESDKAAPGGEATPSLSGLFTAWNTGYTNYIGQYLFGGSSNTKLALVGTDGTNVRHVNSLAPTSVRYRQTDNIYFDIPG